MAYLLCPSGPSLLDLGPAPVRLPCRSVKTGGTSVYTPPISPSRPCSRETKLRAGSWAQCRWFSPGDLFEPFEGRRFDIIVSNPPYVDPALKSSLQREIGYEPEEALFADERGRSVLRRIIGSAESHLLPDGIVLLEIGHDMRDFLLDTGTSAGYTVSVLNDLAGHPRVALLKKQK